MKLPGTVLQAIAVGITVMVVSGGCHKDDVKSGTSQKNKTQKERPVKKPVDNCPTCGMG